LESAGYDPESYPGLIGLYAGLSLNTYLLYNLSSKPGFAPGFAASYPGGSFDTLFGNDRDSIRVGRREGRRWLSGSQSPRSGRCERRGTRKVGPVRPQAIRSPQRQQPSTPALVLHPRSLGRHLGLRGVDEVAQHLPADRRIALQQPLHNRIVLGHRRRSWLVRALILHRFHP
jgi:hypothetical protein